MDLLLEAENPGDLERAYTAVAIARRRGAGFFPREERLLYGSRRWVEAREGRALGLTDVPAEDIPTLICRWLEGGFSSAKDLDHLLERLVARLQNEPARPLFPGGKRWGVLLTHDVDYMQTTWRYRGTRLYFLGHRLRSQNWLSAMAFPRNWPHREVAELIAAQGISSEWFLFAPTERNQRGWRKRLFNPEYTAEQASELAARLRELGHRVSLHASPEAMGNLRIFEEEKNVLEGWGVAWTGGVRAHMGLRRWGELSPMVGGPFVDYDASLLHNEAARARLPAFAAVPVRGGGRLSWEFAPDWMDSAAYNFEGKGRETMKADITRCLEDARLRGGTAHFVFHNFPVWGPETIDHLLQAARRDGAWIGSISELQNHWMKGASDGEKKHAGIRV